MHRLLQDYSKTPLLFEISSRLVECEHILNGEGKCLGALAPVASRTPKFFLFLLHPTTLGQLPAKKIATGGNACHDDSEANGPSARMRPFCI